MRHLVSARVPVLTTTTGHAEGGVKIFTWSSIILTPSPLSPQRQAIR